MHPLQLERFLHAHIPLAKAMEVSVCAVAEDKVLLSAPLRPNINHHQTVFGGSACAVAILAGWSLVHTRLHAEGVAHDLVIHRNAMTYRSPITDDFTACASLPAPEAWEAFRERLARRGKARIEVVSQLEQGGRAAASLSGEFVALAAR
ncbi:YiiD C-terminal domain-containing protein [Eleftheria terrae]|uniref:YiiD C-terminal domain-containing protein n=1 Tax=Eleftheria terrae TaxID=1597781 RepID=UPI00263A913C|nr:YiiD C-terminal domain-containing protein [Eleftheria terrae]WKB54411.1 thioesterase domain-containing protein [Eleftheria terrae]